MTRCALSGEGSGDFFAEPSRRLEPVFTVALDVAFESDGTDGDNARVSHLLLSGDRRGLLALDGQVAGDTAPLLERAIRRVVDDPIDARLERALRGVNFADKLAGDRRLALDALKDLLRGAVLHPASVWSVW